MTLDEGWDGVVWSCEESREKGARVERGLSES